MTDSFHRSLDRALDDARRVAAADAVSLGRLTPPSDEDYSWGLDGAKIRAMQDSINADIAQLAAITAPCRLYEESDEAWEANQYAVRRDPAYDDSWLDVGHAFLDALDIEHDANVVVAWGNPTPVRLEFSLENVDPELLALLFGGVVGVPLCLQRIPAEGQE